MNFVYNTCIMSEVRLTNSQLTDAGKSELCFRRKCGYWALASTVVGLVATAFVVGFLLKNHLSIKEMATRYKWAHMPLSGPVFVVAGLSGVAASKYWQHKPLSPTQQNMYIQPNKR